MATELGGMQVTSLLEALPGIAAVLRNPVADAFVGLIRAGARLSDFKIADAEEILIQRALQETGGNIADAARLLGVHRTRIYRQLARQDEPS